MSVGERFLRMASAPAILVGLVMMGCWAGEKWEKGLRVRKVKRKIWEVG